MEHTFINNTNNNKYREDPPVQDYDIAKIEELTINHLRKDLYNKELAKSKQALKKANKKNKA